MRPHQRPNDAHLSIHSIIRRYKSTSQDQQKAGKVGNSRRTVASPMGHVCHVCHTIVVLPYLLDP